MQESQWPQRTVYPRSRKGLSSICKKQKKYLKLTSCSSHRSNINAWQMDCGNKLIILNYKEWYTIITKGCATSTLAPTEQQGIPEAPNLTTLGKIFIYTQKLVPANSTKEGNWTTALINRNYQIVRTFKKSVLAYKSDMHQCHWKLYDYEEVELILKGSLWTEFRCLEDMLLPFPQHGLTTSE